MPGDLTGPPYQRKNTIREGKIGIFVRLYDISVLIYEVLRQLLITLRVKEETLDFPGPGIFPVCHILQIHTVCGEEVAIAVADIIWCLRMESLIGMWRNFCWFCDSNRIG